MQYQSPIRFLEYADIDYSQAGLQHLSRIKKQIAAEFALQPDGIIVIDGISYTRHSILTVLEHPAFTTQMAYHMQLWSHKSLLHLLEKDSVDFNEIATWQALARDPGFVTFLSPYFAPVFDSVMKALIRRNDFYSACIWMDYMPFVQPEDEETAMKNTRQYLEQTTRLFRNLNAESFRKRMDEFGPCLTESWLLFINKLPSSLLSYIDDLANVMISFTVRIQKAERRICYNVSGQLLGMQHVNYSLKELIASNHAIYKQNYQNRTVRGRFNSFPRVYFIIVVLIAMVRIFASSTDTASSGNNVHFSESYPSLSDESETGKFALIRNFYNLALKVDTLHPVPAAALADIPFASWNTYIRIDGTVPDSGKLYPFVVKNLTARNIDINMVRSNNVFYLEARTESPVSFLPKFSNSMDMILSFDDRTNWADGNGASFSRLQYIHLAPDVKDARVLDFNNDDPIELPYYSNEQIDTLPLQIIISEHDGKYFYRIKGKARVVNYKAASSTAI